MKRHVVISVSCLFITEAFVSNTVKMMKNVNDCVAD